MKIKNNHIIFAVTSAMCLLPVLLSLMLYNDLPEQIAVHWNSDMLKACDTIFV